MPDDKNAIVNVDGFDVPNFLVESGAIVETGEAAGMDSIRTQDMMMPRVKILADLSPEVKSGEFEAGDVIQTMTQQLYLTGSKKRQAKNELAGIPTSIQCIPLVHSPQYIRWANSRLTPNSEFKEMDMSPNGPGAISAKNREREIKDDGNEDQKFIEYHNIFALIINHLDIDYRDPRALIVLSCARSNNTVAKKILNVWKMRPRVAIHANVFEVSVVEESKPQPHYKYKFVDKGIIQDEDTFHRAAQMAEPLQRLSSEGNLKVVQGSSDDNVSDSGYEAEKF